MTDTPITGELIPAGQNVPVKQVRYTDAIAQAICDLLAEGESLRSICRRTDMPDRRTVDRWREDNAEFAARCVRAREAGADVQYDDMEQIERDTLSGALDPKAASVVLSNKRWRMEKLNKALYGNKAEMDVKHSGSVGFALTINPVRKP